MPTKTIVNLASANETYTAAAGDYEINGMGGNDTITTGAGNSFVTTGVGNSTITTGAGDSIVKTLDGNQTITTGAGNSSVTTGVGNSTITTGAGDSTVLASGGNNTVTTGAGASNVTTGVGDDTITAGAGDAVVDSGLGNDTVTTAAGNDLVIYRVTGNAGHHSLFTAAAGVDTLNLVMTRAEWMSDAVQTDVATYLSFLAANKGASGENNATEYTFKAFGLTASAFEKLQVHVDGVSIDPANHPVALGDDEMTTTENEVSAAVDVLSNDSVPDLIKTLTYTNSLNGSVQLDAAYVNTASPAAAQFIYTPTAGFYDYLAVGETASDVFTYTVTDATGDVKTATVNVTITGTNDAPVITSATQAAGVSEGNDKPLSAMSASGTVGYRDVDLSDMHTLSISTAAAYGNASVDAQGNWSYTVVDAGAVNALAVGEHLADSFTVMVDDGHGGKALQSVHIEITGTNDAPIITSSAQAGAVKEDAALVATGTVASSDVDNGATATYTGSATGTYGSFAVNAATGVWTYTLANAAHQNLAQGESQSETFTVTVTDDKGAAASQVVVMSITGTNDAPVIGTAVLSSTVTEQITPAGNLISSGAINFSDVDLSDVHTVSAVMSAADTLGSLTATVSTDDSHTTGLDGVVTWAYSVADSAVEYLAAGQTKVETFTVSLSDGHGGVVQSTVSVTIAGTNDAAVITGAASSNLTETNAAQSTSGTLSATDVDSSAAFTVRSGVAGSNGYGSFGINAAGAWTYAMNSAHNEFAGGTNYTDSFTVATADGTQQVVSVTIAGTNDAPVITTADLSGSLFVSPTNVSAVGSAYLNGNQSLVNTLGGTHGFGENILPANDDGSSASINITSMFGAAGINFFGNHYTSLYVNNNGNLSFTGPDNTFSPGPLSPSKAVIAPFWYDVDTRNGSSPVTPGGNSTGSDLVYWDIDSTNRVFTATWDDVGRYPEVNSVPNAYQVQLIDEGSGNFDIVYRYENINYSTGARAGYSSGNGVNAFELAQSSNPSSMLTLGTTLGNTGTQGVYEFSVRAGSVTAANLTETGVIKFTDEDRSDVHLVSPTGTAIGSTLGTLTAVQNSDTTGSGIGGQITWNYSVSQAAIQSVVAPGQTRIESFTINLNDQHGGVITEQINITINGTGQALAGGPGSDVLNGSAISDVISGLGGNDQINGLGGNDLLTGGLGADTFVFNMSAGNDTITDFSGLGGEGDKIFLTGISGVNNFAQVLAHTTQDGNNAVIHLSPADSITLISVNVPQLAASDFMFA